MEIYKILQSIMDEQGLNIAQVARKSGLPDSTVRGIIKRKQKTVAIEVAFKLSDGLGVSLERLNGMPERDSAEKTLPFNLSPDEIELILSYRRASQDDKIIVQAALRKYSQPEMQETASAG